MGVTNITDLVWLITEGHAADRVMQRAADVFPLFD